MPSIMFGEMVQPAQPMPFLCSVGLHKWKVIANSERSNGLLWPFGPQRGALSCCEREGCDQFCDDLPLRYRLSEVAKRSGDATPSKPATKPD